MNWNYAILFILITSFAACKSLKQQPEEMQYWVIELQKGLDRSYLEETYAEFKIDKPRPNNRTLNQFISGFELSSQQEVELIALFDKDENIIKYAKSNSSSEGIQSSTNSGKAKISPIKSSKH